jgi:hypothetical protein
LVIGVFAVDNHFVQVVASTLGCFLVLALITWTCRRSPMAWRGWTFALLGWLVPVATIVFSRVGYIGVHAVEQVMYYYFPTWLFLLGALEACAAPSRATVGHRVKAVRLTSERRPYWGPALCPAAVVALLSSYCLSAGPTISSTNYGMIGPPDAPERDYMATLVESAHELQAAGRQFSVINGIAPAGLLNFQGHNRLSQITSLHDPGIPFDGAYGPYYIPDRRGKLLPADPKWQAELSRTSVQGALTYKGVAPSLTGPDGSFCFTVTQPGSQLQWNLARPISGGPLVIRTLAKVDRDTLMRVSTSTAPGGDIVVANVNPRLWPANQVGRLDTTPEPQVSVVVIDSLTVGASMCLLSMQVGHV